MLLRYVSGDETGRITVVVQDKEYTDDSYFEFDFPEDFDFDKQNDYLIIDGKLIHDPAPIPEEIVEFENNKKRNAQLEAATLMFVRTSAKTFSDEEALSVEMLFNEWQPDTKYEKDDIVRYKNNIYRIGQDHTSQSNWVPGEPGSESLYSLIHIDEGGYEIWKEFDGISGIYKEGQIVRDPSDDKLYKSKIPNNVWGPPHEQPRYWKLYEE